MHGIILAAGRGSRMKCATDDHPKCLTELGGKPLLAWQISALQDSGVYSLAIVTGYLAETLHSNNYITFHNADWSKTNMVMSLVTASDWLRENSCIVSYSDIVYHPDIVQLLCKVNEDIVITYDRQWRSLWTQRFPDPLSDAETFRVDNQGKLLEIGQVSESIEDIHGQYMGLLKFTRRGWAQVERLLDELTEKERNTLDMTALLNRLIDKNVLIHTAAIDGKWCEVDNEQDLALYKRLSEQETPWVHDWR
jgi:choline kinase